MSNQRSRADRRILPDNSPLQPELVGQATELERLKDLDPFDYDREREATATKLGIRVSTLDKHVKAARKSSSVGHGRPIEFEEIKPWNEPVDGAELLNAIAA